MKKPMNKVMPLMMAAALATSSVPVATVSAQEAEYYTVNMNVSYHDFYGAYGVDTTKGVTDPANYVDAVTSATKKKAAKNGPGELCAGTYYTTDENYMYINGVTVPVVVDKASYEKLIAAGTFQTSDFTALTAESQYPAMYLNANVVSPAGIVSGTAVSQGAVTFTAPAKSATTLTNVTAQFTTSTKYGDYQLDLEGTDVDANIASGETTVYGVVINTKEEGKYAMYALENIWKNFEIAWSAGFITEVHSCPLRSDVYKSMMGETITDVTYYTDKGTFSFDIADVYVPITTDIKATAKNPTVADATTIEVTLENVKEDYAPEFTLSSTSEITATVTAATQTKNENGTVTYNVTAANVVPGIYTLDFSDKNGKYAPGSTTFTANGSNVTAENNNLVLSPAIGADNIANYVKNITSVEVTTAAGVTVTYLPAKSGSTNHFVATLFDSEGKLNTEAAWDYVEATKSGKKTTYTVVSNGAVFANDDNYSIKVTSLGYEDVSFTYTKKAEADPVVTPTVEPTATPVEKVAVGTTATVSKLKYKVTKNSGSTKTATVTGVSNKKLKTLTIPATVKIKGETFKVTVIGNNAFKSCTKATTVTIGKNVTKIGSKAFYGDKAIKKITVKSKNIKTIGAKAFAGVKKTATIKVPASKKAAYKKLAKKAGFKGSVK